MPRLLRERFAPAWERYRTGSSQFGPIGNTFSFFCLNNFGCTKFKFEQNANSKKLKY
jgi:hypothetical protein